MDLLGLVEANGMPVGVMAEQFVGSGWAFPLRTGPTGGIAMVSGEREIEEAIRLDPGHRAG